MLRTVVCVIVALAWIANPVAAQDKKAPEKKVADKAPAKAKFKSPLKGEYSIMAAKCDLTEEQQNKIAEIVAAHNKAVDDGVKADKAKVAEAQKAFTEAKKGKDAAATAAAKKNVTDAQTALKSDKEALDAKEKTDIQALLTAEQKTKWDSFTAFRKVVIEMGWAKLTPAQKTKIEAIADETSPKMRGEGKNEEEVIAAIKTQSLELLTEAQKKLAKPEKEKPKKKAAETKPAEEPKKQP